MKYLINITSDEAVNFSALLINEISRFDLRAQIFLNNDVEALENTDEERLLSSVSKTIDNRHFRINDYDLLVVIGTEFGKIGSWKNNKGMKTCFFQITNEYKRALEINRNAVAKFDKVFPDLPLYPKNSENIHLGYYLNDVIRKHEFEHAIDQQLTISFIVDYRSNLPAIVRLVRALSINYQDCKWVFSGKGINKSDIPRFAGIKNIELAANKLNQLKKSNAVFVDSDISSITAALINCPQIYISNDRKYLGLSVSPRKPLINEFFDDEVIRPYLPQKPKELAKELDLLLNNHEYCATQLTSYQMLKEKIGANPVVREAAQKIVDWLEEERD